jgi:hypothetical protein
MPRLKIKNIPPPEEVFRKVWFEIPVNSSVPVETYLIQPRVADYIELLEEIIGEKKLPKLECLNQLKTDDE